MDLLGEAPPARVRVLLDGTQSLELDYALGPFSAEQLFPGRRVSVPLRGREAGATVLEHLLPGADASPPLWRLKPLASISPVEQSLTPGLLALARRVADYYLCPLDSVLKTVLPGGLRDGDSTRRRLALERLDLAPDAPRDANNLPIGLARAKRQTALWHALERTAAPVPLQQLETMGFPRAVAHGLVQRGLARIVPVEAERDPFADLLLPPSPPHPLNGEQAEALAALLAEAHPPRETPPRPILLHGVTGSGKTEVFLQAAAAVLAQGRQVLVLVPEIALTPQTVQRFKARFASRAERVAVLHSHLSEGERDDQWRRIRRGDADIVIGARSAVFAPLDRLGLVVVDEEHEGAYKQDQAPRYHGRDLAVLRGHIEKCAVLLGSATPSLESWANVEAGKYLLARLTRRVDSAALPLIRVLDMKQEARRIEAGGPPIFSEPLRQALERRLQDGQQAILFLNRRGYSRALQCPECGEPVKCRHCDLALTYHRSEEILLCHLCGYRALPPKCCPACSSPGVALLGFGTQRVEETFAKLFPRARAARIDADTMRRKHALRTTLDDFQAGRIQVLIGTQMIAKGLHVPNVTLVGVLNADLGLHAPDPRASERVFQLLVQVSGRAGRGELEGEVIVQTFVPHAPAIQFARHHDVDGFVEAEMEWRRAAGHPPFSRLVLLATRSPNEKLGLFALENLAARLRKAAPRRVRIGEPAPSPLARAQDLHRAQLLLRAPTMKAIVTPLRQVLAATPMPEEVHLIIDVDPLNFG